MVVFAPTIDREGQPYIAWPSKKAMRSAAMIGALLLASIAVNAVIILATAN
jgi:hypothetical protein